MDAETAEEEQFGPYLVYERLGVGGMATVHRALERGIEGFERMVALKRLLPHLAEDASFIKSFVREAKLASLLNHVNIVQIYELGRVATEYFISMEYIEGRDVRRVLRHARKVTGPPAIHVTVGLLLQLCEALDYAHHKSDDDGVPLRLVHRDISPSNLLVTPAGHLKVIDFGIAKAQSSQLRTQTGRVKGKLAYMAPEAITGGKELDARSDLWAVGVIAHELLTARPLFASKNEYQTLLKVQRGDIIPPSTFNQACPPELDAIVAQALAREPDERFATAGDLRDALLDLRRKYTLQTGHRDIAGWLDWAFSVEAPTGGFAGNTNERSGSNFEMTGSPSSGAGGAAARRRSSKGDEDEAVELAWGGAEPDEVRGGPIVLDDIPDVSEKHLGAAPVLDPQSMDDIPAPTPQHGPVSRASTAPIDAPSTRMPTSRLTPTPTSLSRSIGARTPAPVLTPRAPTAGSAPPTDPTGNPVVDAMNTAMAALGVEPATDPNGEPAPETTDPNGEPLSDDLDFPMQRPARLTSRATPIPIARATPTPTAPPPAPPATAMRGAKPSVPPPPGARMSASLLPAPPTVRTTAAPHARDATVDEAIAPPPPPRATPSPSHPKGIGSPDSSLAQPPPRPTPPARPTPTAPPATARAESSARESVPSLAVATAVRVPTTKPGVAVPPPRALSAADAQGLAIADPASIDIDLGEDLVATQPKAKPKTKKQHAPRAPADISIGASIAERGNKVGRGIAPWKIVTALVLAGGAATAVTLYLTRDQAVAPIEDGAAGAASATAGTVKKTGMLKFNVEPRDSSITIEGHDKHEGSPWSIELPAGTHNVTIEHASYKPYLVAVDLDVDDKQSLRVVLEPLDKNASSTGDATLIIGSNPDGLEVVIDGKPTGQRTPVRAPLPVGPHQIVLRQNGVDVWHYALVAKANSVSEVNATIAKPQTKTTPAGGTSRVERTVLSPRTDSEPKADAPPAKQEPKDELPSTATTSDHPPPIAPPPVTPPPTPPPVAPTPPAIKPPPPVAPPPTAPVRTAGPVTVAPNKVTKLSGETPHLSVGKTSDIPSTVAAKLCIDASGKVTSVDLITKLEHHAASDLTDAMHAWRYAPYKDNGTAVPACFAVALRTK